MKQLCVLLSTYNGEKYIIEQLHSIFTQEVDSCHVKVLIRDDGSGDNTVEICRLYAKNNGYDIEVIEGDNVKPAKSFLQLIMMCPEADYYAFCDQDDVWLPGKITAAVPSLDNDKPSLWISNYNVVDDKLGIILSNALEKPELNPLKMLFYNNVPGCVMMFNPALLKEIRSLEITDFRMHDILALNVAQLTGNVYFENNPYVLYRQHSNNVLGFGHKRINPFKWIVEKTAYLFDGEDYHIRNYASAVVTKYKNTMIKELIQEFELISKYKSSVGSKMKLLAKPYTKDGFNRTSISIRLKILLGRF